MALQTRSRKIAATQAALNSRTGRGAGAASAAPATPAATTSTYPWMSVRMANIALVIAAVVVSIWGLYIPARWSNPHPANIGSWGRGHWFSLLLLWGIVAALIRLNACGAVTKTLQWVLAGIVVAMLVVFPLWGLATSPAAPAHAIAATHAAEWHRLDLAAGEESEGIEVPVGTRLAFDGDEGIVLRTVYADGSICITPREACPKKPIANSFLVNEATTSGKVAYTFK